jgi:hypothetical protein
MTDEEEFAARSRLKWTREGDAWLSPPANGPRGPRQEPPRHVAISQSRRHPKRHGRMGCCKRPLKMPSKNGGLASRNRRPCV